MVKVKKVRLVIRVPPPIIILFLLLVDDKAFSKLVKRPQRIVAAEVNPAFSNNCCVSLREYEKMNKSVASCLVIRYLAVPSIIASSPILPYPHAENITYRVLQALLFETSHRPSKPIFSHLIYYLRGWFVPIRPRI